MKNILTLLLITFLLSSVSFAQKSYGSDLSATIAIPTGPGSEYSKLGYGAIGGFYYEMESSWRIGLTLGFIRFGVNSIEVNNYFQTLGQEGYIDINGSVSTIPVLLSAKYIFPSASSTKFYAILEGGLYVYWTKVNGKIVYTGTSPGEVLIDESEFTSEIGWNFGLGSLFSVSKEVSIDVNVRYHLLRNQGTIKVKYDNNYTNGEETVGSSYFLNIGIGANWNFDL
jgi:hypothetical protein